MKQEVRAGLLPLYLELYDRIQPALRDEFAPFLTEIEGQLANRGIHVTRESICRRQDEVRAAVQRLDSADVDIIVTLHLSYSPSLETVDALEATQTPLLLLDTTVDEAFAQDTHPDRLMYNHGIHGVQDLASVLLRRQRPYEVVAGHWRTSDIVARAAAYARAAAAARALRRMKVLRIGASFAGMGDFHVEESILRERLGVTVVQQDVQPIALAAAALNDVEIRREMEQDRARYVVEATEESHFRSAQAGLALSRLVNELGCGACSFNFLAFDCGKGALSTVPFLGASKLMAEGFGYAGEGDALTAALVGALNGIFRVNFTEMFCPDWRNNSIFLSHMGEFNPACAEGPVRLVEKPFPWTAAQNPAIVTGAMQRGPAVLVNLAPGPDDRFRLIAAPVDVLDDAVHPEMRDSIRGWVRPPGSIARFLEWYSRAGGTHHCALVHDQTIETLRAFASYAGIPIEFPHKRGEWGA